MFKEDILPTNRRFLISTSLSNQLKTNLHVKEKKARLSCDFVLHQGTAQSFFLDDLTDFNFTHRHGEHVVRIFPQYYLLINHTGCLEARLNRLLEGAVTPSKRRERRPREKKGFSPRKSEEEALLALKQNRSRWILHVCFSLSGDSLL